MKKKFGPGIVILLIVAALAALYFQRARKPQPEPAPVSGKLVVRFLDIGQGDCELIQLPGGETILIDSGDSGKPTVDLLKQYGVKRIDLAIATHPHADHIGEMRDVMRQFEVAEFWDSGFSDNPTRTYREMLEEIRNRGIRFKVARRGDTRTIGEVLLEVLNPGPRFPSEEPNDASIVVRLTFGGKSFLFTGDSEIYPQKPSAWREMLTTERDKLRADVLKAAHHGSSNGTTPEVLEAVRPSIYTISCAVGNDYHHPHPKVVDLLERNKGAVNVYRTDLQGTITAVCDGKTIEMSVEKQVPEDRLYLTGDEVAGNVAGGQRKGGDQPDSMPGGKRGKRAR